MLKKRIIPKFLVSQGRLVKGIRFHENWREAGNPFSVAKVYSSYGVDEAILLDIDAGPERRIPDMALVDRFSQEVFMPLTVGGGIRSVADVGALLMRGADKVSINTGAFENPTLVSDLVRQFGSQCVVVAVDYRRDLGGENHVMIRGGRQETAMDPIDWARRACDLGAGEILLCSVDRDGTLKGYDLDLLSRASSLLPVPVIASSGAGSLEDCARAFDAGASAITISSLFLFTDHSPIRVRSYLKSNGYPVRASRSGRN